MGCLPVLARIIAGDHLKAVIYRPKEIRYPRLGDFDSLTEQVDVASQRNIECSPNGHISWSDKSRQLVDIMDAI